MSGASLGGIADVVGHKNPQMVKRYSHIAEDHRAKVVSRLNESNFPEEGKMKASVKDWVKSSDV